MDTSTVPFRVGIGYDIHRFAPGRQLVLGGVTIPADEGLDGHSDADVLSHALADAILGALSLPDIGHFFPNDDPDIKDINSQRILARAADEARRRGYRLLNIDAALIAEKPRIAKYIGNMRDVLSQTLGIPAGCIGIKATTNEKIGDLGRGHGIAAHAVCILAADQSSSTTASSASNQA